MWNIKEEEEVKDKKYEPELGQLCSRRPWRKYAASDLLQTALECLSMTYGVLFPDRPNPFQNTGAVLHISSRFSVQAYVWDEDEEESESPPNFCWRDLEISWYKWCGRGVSVNRSVSDEEVQVMLRDCMESLLEEQEE